MKLKSALRVVWNNDINSRYVPRALTPGIDSSWGVFDQIEQRFIEDGEVTKINPSEKMRAH